MNRNRWAVLGVVLVACSGGDGNDGSGSDAATHVCDGTSLIVPSLPADYAPSFAGTWVGTLTIDGQPGQVALPISADGVNRLQLTGLCEADSRTPAAVQSALTFQSACVVCAPIAVTGCDSVTLTYTDGTATLSGTTTPMLLFEFTGTMAGCGQSFPMSGEFQGWLASQQTVAGEPVSGTAARASVGARVSTNELAWR